MPNEPDLDALAMIAAAACCFNALAFKKPLSAIREFDLEKAWL